MPFPKLPKVPDPRHWTPRFRDLLYEHRTLRGLTIEEVAGQAGIAPSALREMEAGTRPAPSTTLAKALAKALQLTGEERGDFIDAAELDSRQMDAIFGASAERALQKAEQAPAAAIFAFLIADIRGYTSYTERHGDEAAARLSMRFAELARTALERWDGRLVEMRGDEALGVFASARQAVRAAGDLTARYAEEVSARPDLPQGIGVGLDVGEAVPVENGFRGAALNRAARLCSLAGPGEILVSPGVVYVAPHVAGVHFVTRGHEQLKGFPEPVAISQVAPGELPAIVDADAEDAPADEEG